MYRFDVDARAVAEGSETAGLSDAEMAASLGTLTRLAEECGSDVTELRTHVEASGKVADVMVRSRMAEDDFIDLRIAVVGNVDAGKSTMLGVLTHGGLDDGRGKCRAKIFRHKHEVDD